MTCTSGGPRTHAVFSKCQIDKASQALTYNKTIVCADAVNAEVLLRLARNELLERAQEANRQVTALVDEEYVYLLTRFSSQSAQHGRLTINSDRLDGDIPFDRARTVIITSRYVPHSQYIRHSLTAIGWPANIDSFDKVFYSACPAHCESQNFNVTADPRKPVALSHITNIPGLMRVVSTE